MHKQNKVIFVMVVLFRRAWVNSLSAVPSPISRNEKSSSVRDALVAMPSQILDSGKKFSVLVQADARAAVCVSAMLSGEANCRHKGA